MQHLLPPHDDSLKGRAEVIARESLAGFISALVTIAYCISFSALIFQGNLSSGIGLGLAALLTGSALTGAIVALTTTLPPADAGPDTPAVAVMSVLAATVAAPILAGGGSTGLAIQHVMLAITLSTLLTGVLFLALGSFRLGQLVRFVPYPVVGGFLAASGMLMLTGSLEVVGLNLLAGDDGSPFDWGGFGRMVLAIGFAAALFATRYWLASTFALPILFFGATLFIHAVILATGGMGRETLFLASGGGLETWWPLAAATGGTIDGVVLLRASVEIFAVAGVTLIALLLDVTSLEVARGRTADLDREFRSNGTANVAAGLAGGVAGNLSLQASILIAEAGGRARFSGLAAATTLALVVVSGLDIAGLVPTPVLAGLLIFLGGVMLKQAFVSAPGERVWSDLMLAGAIMVVIVWFGYLVGVVIGLLGACLLFAFNYSRIGAVRRHVTRAEFSSNVERSATETQALRQYGRAIHIFWLDGFLFFGSSNRVFETIRAVIDGQPSPRVRHVILDCRNVPGFDSSALLSLIKLRHHADDNAVTLVFARVRPGIEMALEKAGLIGEDRLHRIARSRNEALEWCEDELLDFLQIETAPESAFEDWLARELGPSGEGAITAYFERRALASGALLYREGDAADSIDFVLRGRLAVTIADDEGRPLRLKRMSGRTVVGEMGFFRRTVRAASVTAEEETVVLSLTRSGFERMQNESPEMAMAFLQLIVRVLSDRMETANREVAALL